MKRFLPVLLVVFGSSWGCGDCGPTSPGGECVAWADKQDGVRCFSVGETIQCNPVFKEVCTEWECR